MIDNSNYSEQFRQETRMSLSPQPSLRTNKKFTASTIAAIVFGVIALVESVFLIVVIANGLLSFEQDIPYEDDSDFETESDDGDYHYYYNDAGELTAFEINCTAPSGDRFTFTSSNRYTEYGSSASVIDTGSYEIINDSLISLSSLQPDSNHVLYYDGNSVAKNTTVYQCLDVTSNQSSSAP